MPPLRSLLCQIMPKTYNDFAHALLSNDLPLMYNCDTILLSLSELTTCTRIFSLQLQLNWPTFKRLNVNEMELSAHTRCNNLWTGSRVTILGNPGQMGVGGEAKSKRAEKYDAKKSKNDSARLDFSLPPLNAPGSPRMTSDIKQLI